MKNLTLIFITIILMALPVNQGCNLLDEKSESNVVESYHQSVVDVTLSLDDFIQKAQVYESSNYDKLDAKQSLKVINDFITSGEKLIADVSQMQKSKTKSASTGFKSTADFPCSVCDLAPGDGSGMSPAFMKGIADLIAETKGEVSKIEAKFNNKEITEDQYDAALKQLAKMKTVKAANFGFSAILGTGASGLTGAAISSVGGIGAVMSAPAIIAVVGVGAVVGTGYYLISNWYYGIQKNGLAENQMYVFTAKGKIGDPIPTTLLKNGANLTIAIDGYAPVYIPSFQLPAAGNKKSIEIKSLPLKDAAPGTKIEVCTKEEVYVAQGCSEILYVSGSPSPADPGPGQGVTVTATIFPAVVGCDVAFSITGTDGYSKSSNYQSNSKGQASFYIPGGAAGVYDIVTITASNGMKHTVTYTF